MSEWFEACAACERPEGCLAILSTVVGENRAMKALYGSVVSVDGPSTDLLSQGADLISDATQDAIKRLRTIDCAHSDITMRTMIVEALDG